MAAHFVKLDMTDLKAVKKSLQAAQISRLDVLICNAGIMVRVIAVAGCLEAKASRAAG